MQTKFVTKFWKISLNVTFDNIYDQIEEKGHPINFTKVKIRS